MTRHEIPKPDAVSLDDWDAMLNELERRRVERSRQVAPCPKCNSTDIHFSNCGYSSFDVAHADCGSCKHRIVVSCSSDARPDWNRYRDDPAKRELFHWLLAEEGKMRMSPEVAIVDAAAEIFRKDRSKPSE